jgi:hypothetical protein
MTQIQNALLLSIVSSLCVSPLHAITEEEAWFKLAGEKARANPAMAYVTNNPALPNVFIYGDSVSQGYTPRVRENLEGKANVYRIPSNGWDTSAVIPHMERMKKGMSEHWHFTWDVIHFNAGLHDLKYLDKDRKYDTENGTQVCSPEDYCANLRKIFAYFKTIAPNSQIIFATTTPVPEGALGRICGDEKKYNAAALELLKEYPEIIINDLHSLVVSNLAWNARPGDVHYNVTGYNALGDQVTHVMNRGASKSKFLTVP